MNSYLDRLNKKSLNIIQEVGISASKMGSRSFVIGGCVRDLILKKEILDLDLAVDGDAIAVAKIFARRCQGRVVVYPAFSTATVTMADGRAVDFSMIRKEQYVAPGALPTVSQGTLTDDLFRRDFTINAMAIAIDPKDFGRLVDENGGLDDLKAGKIRVLHEHSFVDDPTRILRAVRFEQRFGFRIEDKTLLWLRKAVKTGALKSVKPQRLFEEFKKNLQKKQVVLNLKRLSQLSFFLNTGWGCRVGRSELELCGRIPQMVEFVDGQSTQQSKVQEWLIDWTALCSSVPKIQLSMLLSSIALSRSQRNQICSALDSVKLLKKLKMKKLSMVDVFKLLEGLSSEELIFLGAQLNKGIVLDRIKWFLTKGRFVTLKINGQDLNRLGIPPGKIFKDILREVLFCVVDGQCRSKTQQLAYARKLYQLSQM